VHLFGLWGALAALIASELTSLVGVLLATHQLWRIHFAEPPGAQGSTGIRISPEESNGSTR
jgi:hypothetical protein